MKQKRIFHYGVETVESRCGKNASAVHLCVVAGLMIGFGWCNDLASGYAPQEVSEITPSTAAHEDGATPGKIVQATDTIANQPASVSSDTQDHAKPVSDPQAEVLTKSTQESDQTGSNHSLAGGGKSALPTSPGSAFSDNAKDGSASSPADTVNKNQQSDAMSKMESRALPPDPRQSGKVNAKSKADEIVQGDDTSAVAGGSFFSRVDSPDWILKTLGALGVVIGLILLMRPVLKRFAGPLGAARAPSGVIEALARYPFGKGQSLVLLKLDRRVLFICQTSQGSNLITEMTDPEDVASILRRVHDENGESFNRKLEDMLQGNSGQDTVRQGNGILDDSTDSSGIVDLTTGGNRRSWLSLLTGNRSSGAGAESRMVTPITVK